MLQWEVVAFKFKQNFQLFLQCRVQSWVEIYNTREQKLEQWTRQRTPFILNMYYCINNPQNTLYYLIFVIA